MQNLPAWTETFDWSKKYTDQWIAYFQYLFGYELKSITDLQTSKEEQAKGIGDLLVEFENYTKLSIELKTRKAKYHEYFKSDRLLAIETKANVQADKSGSSIFNSKADIWANGFIVNERLTDPIAYWREPFVQWLEPRQGEFTSKQSDTSNLYNTRFLLVPLAVIQQFEARLPYF